MTGDAGKNWGDNPNKPNPSADFTKPEIPRKPVPSRAGDEIQNPQSSGAGNDGAQAFRSKGSEQLGGQTPPEPPPQYLRDRLGKRSEEDIWRAREIINRSKSKEKRDVSPIREPGNVSPKQGDPSATADENDLFFTKNLPFFSKQWANHPKNPGTVPPLEHTQKPLLPEVGKGKERAALIGKPDNVLLERVDTIKITEEDINLWRSDPKEYQLPQTVEERKLDAELDAAFSKKDGGLSTIQEKSSLPQKAPEPHGEQGNNIISHEQALELLRHSQMQTREIPFDGGQTKPGITD